MGEKKQEKQQDPCSAARIRNNQRRSRARHREFVEELKARVREYERQGVQATLEMRAAARSVALENSRLRSLLASRGVTREEVERYLASFGDQAVRPLPPTGVALPTEQADRPAMPGLDLSREPVHDGACYSTPSTKSSCDTRPLAANTPQQNTDPGGARQPSPMDGRNIETAESDRCPSSSTSASALDTLAAVAGAGVSQTCCGPTTQCLLPPNGQDVGQGHGAEPSFPDSGPASPSPGPKTPSAATSPLEMPCTAAAHILADIYRDGNEELVRQALGCSGAEECVVKNTTLFQLLDR